MHCAARRVRLLIVDDSAVTRSWLRAVVASDTSVEVVGTAADGAAALAAVEDLRPDMILLDVDMPVLDGLRTLRMLREGGHALPVIMCSSLTRHGARITIEALAAGASDYVAKPTGQVDSASAIRLLAAELLPKIQALAAASFDAANTPQAVSPVPIAAAPSVVVVGASTGGPAALETLLAGLPAEFPLPVLVAQHMPEVFTGPLAERLNAHCALRVREASGGETAAPGTIWIARGDWHLELRAALPGGRDARLHLMRREPENHCRPSVDVLFHSSAAVFGAGVVAVVLTGMGSDGAAGARMVRAAGGVVLAQNQQTSTVWGMPGAVVRAGLAHRVLPIEAIAGEVVHLAGRLDGAGSGRAKTARECAPLHGQVAP